MGELGNYYIKNIDTKESIKINLTTDKYMTTQIITLKSIFKNFFIELFFYLFKKDKATEETLPLKIENVVSHIYNEYNEHAKENEMETIDYKTHILNQCEKCPNYIM